MTTTKKIVLLGAGGHARVVADLIGLLPGCAVAATLSAGRDSELPGLLKKGVRAAAVGVGDTAARARLRRMLLDLGFTLPPLVHPRAVVASSARLGPGAQVMAGAVVNAGARIGAGVVVNTGAVIEHDCVLGDDCFIGPRAALGGTVTVGEGAFIGLGACVLPGLRVGKRALVGAGAVVARDVRAGARAWGVPAKERA